MEFGASGLAALERVTDLQVTLELMTVPPIDVPAVWRRSQVENPAGVVDHQVWEALLGTDHDGGRDQARAGLVGAGDHIRQPAGLEDHVIVDEGHELGGHQRHGDVAGLVGRQEPFGADVGVARAAHRALHCLADRLRRAAVHIDQLETDIGRRQDRLERHLGLLEALTGRDHDGYPAIGGHPSGDFRCGLAGHCALAIA